MKIGVITDSFRTDFFQAVKQAKECGASGVQTYASGNVVNTQMTAAVKKDVKSALSDAGLCFSALCADMGNKLFYYPDAHKELIEKQKRIIDLAKELGTNIITGHIGAVDTDTASWQYKALQDSYGEISLYAASCGARYAVETGPETAEVLFNFLKSVNNKGAAVNLDPANLVMCADDDPVQAVHILKDYIVHTHAKDGIMLKKTDTRAIYAAAVFDLEPLNERVYEEVPLGSGSVDFDGYMTALKDIGYTGFLTVEREVGKDPAADIKSAVIFLNKYLGDK